ncbi:MAG: hypothetical protein A7316_08185 [Candidatus Altiarchaeales archaeon WOR_SM1_86-2]|nr:MAG: hypothetical protein A7316_08185 [Candidatus Altiarchaeales archaeon WOR_SM1_86-2]
MPTIIDAYAWIEYFKGTSQGEVVKEHLDKEGAYTPINVLADVYYFFKRINRDFDFALKVIKSKSDIYDFNEDEWLQSVEIKHELRKKMKDFGIMDALVMACAENLKGAVITGDPHFKDEDNVIFLGD